MAVEKTKDFFRKILQSGEISGKNPVVAYIPGGFSLYIDGVLE